MFKARTLNRPALVASCVVTLVVLILEFTGSLQRLEGVALDERFVWARSSPEPLSEHIVLVAIDDSSERLFGRWPWDRARQAIGIDEISRAGAKVVAFDVMYAEPSESPVADQALADAIRACRGIVGANVDPEELIGELWQSPEGRRLLERLLETLGSAITMPRDEVIERVGLVAPWKDRFFEQQMAFRELAAWTRLATLRAQGRRPATVEQFLDALGIPKTFVETDWPERRMIVRLWQRDCAWEALARFMAPVSGIATARGVPPILQVAEAAGGVGMVVGQADRGGQMRRVHPATASPVGDCVQLGIVAAAAFRGVESRDVRIEHDRVIVGDASIPVHQGRVVIDWPTVTFDGWPALRGGGTKRLAIPFSTFLSRGLEREKQARQEVRYREYAADVAARLSKPPEQLTELPVEQSVRRDVLNSIEFNYAGLFEKGLAVLPEDASEDEILGAKLFLQWAALEEAVLQGRRTLERADQQLREALEGRLVLIGHVATGAMADMINTPFGPRTPGVFVHAAVASMVLEGRGLRFVPTWIDPAATVLLAGLCAIIAAGVGAGRGSVLVLLVLATYFVACWLAFGVVSIVLPMIGPLTAGFGSWVAGVTLVAVISQRERARVMRQFKARVSPQLVERLAANPDALSVGGVEREVTILFGDLAGFTTLSEQLEGAEVVRTLNRYMGSLTRELTARGAYVNKFLGDGLLAFWSAFGEEPAQRQLAVEASLACQEAVAALGQDPQFRDRPPIRLRLGIATGEVVVGDCGAPPELNDYTVIGDAVNLSSRLESANKQFGTPILMDGTTAAGVRNAPGAPPLLGLGRVIVVGQSVPVELFTVVDSTMTDEIRRSIETAVAAFREGDRAAALTAWRAIAAGTALASIAKPFLQVLEDASEPMDGTLRLRAK